MSTQTQPQPRDTTGIELDQSTKHDNGYIAISATLFEITYEYVFKPQYTGYTLGKFRVNDRTYNQLAAGDTGLPGERAAAERAFHEAETTHNVTFNQNSIGHKVPRDLVGVTAETLTSPATDNTDEQLSMTLDGIRDESNVTLTRGDYIYDYHTDTTYEVGLPHRRGRGACAREVEFRELPDGEFRTLNLSHVDTKLHRGRWQVVESNPSVTAVGEYVGDDSHVVTDTVVTDFSRVADGLTESSTMRITAIRTILGVGTRVVLTPETSFDYVNDLNVRAVPITEFINANPTSQPPSNTD